MPIVSTTAALLAGAGISGGAGIASAAIGSHAAGKAADQQQESADKALALQQQMYQQQRADLAPWRNAGGQAVTTLSGLMGLPSGPVGGEAAMSSGINTTPQTQQALARYARQADTNTLSGPGVPKAFPASSSYPDQPPVVPGSQTASGYVTMEAPNGERQQVPREQLEHFQSFGARVV